MNRKLVPIACILVSFQASLALGDAPATKAADPAEVAKKVSRYAHRLSGNDPIDVEAAIIGLSRMPPTEFTAIVAEADDSSLTPRAREELKKFIDRERPSQAARLRIANSDAGRRDRLINRDLGVYTKRGKHDPKWDDAAGDAIRGFDAGMDDNQTRASAEKAIAAGSDDPLILYVEARMLDRAGANPDIVQQLYERATTGIYSMNFPVDRMMFCALRAATHLKNSENAKLRPGQAMPAEKWATIQQLLQLGLRPWPALLKYHPSDETLREAGELAIDVYDNVPQGRKNVYDLLDRQLQMAFPDTSMALTLKGYFYIAYAWDARGGGWAKDVTPDGWKLMSERLLIAEQALTRAWEKDNTNSEAAAMMLKVELGQGKGRDRMELWFKRAMEANPDNLEACNLKMYYLQPKWHGTPQDMLAFGHECFETHNWHGRLPFKQVDAIEDLRAYTNDEKAYLTSPAVWKALTGVYEPYLRNDPRAHDIRSGYCKYACLSGHWDVAREQFAILGSSAVASRFGGAEVMGKMRAIAEQKGIRPNVP